MLLVGFLVFAAESREGRPMHALRPSREVVLKLCTDLQGTSPDPTHAVLTLARVSEIETGPAEKQALLVAVEYGHSLSAPFTWAYEPRSLSAKVAGRPRELRHTFKQFPPRVY